VAATSNITIPVTLASTTITGTPAVSLASTTITSISAGTNTIGDVTVGNYNQRQFIDVARTAYAVGIRTNLVWS
jgi:5,10-methylenetetrahydrofolate reductase